MSKKYIDVKVTVWNRYELSELADMQDIVEKVKNGDPIDDVLESMNLFDDPDFAYVPVEGTEEMLDVNNNDGFSTIEIYDETENAMMPIYTNEIVIHKN